MHNFDTVEMGPELITNFTFTNKTKQPIKVTYAGTGIGSTCIGYDQSAVAPRRKGIIKAHFMTKDQPGKFTVHPIVKFSNGKEIYLTITGYVTMNENKPEKPPHSQW